MAKLPEQLFAEEALREIVRATVKETLKEIKKSGFLKKSDDIAYAEISERLNEYYKAPERDKELAAALERLKVDYYFDVIPQFYKSKITIEWIAEAYHSDVSTIVRNKKRLCLRLYQLVN